MKMTKIAAMLSLLLTGAVLADQLPFYSITEVTSATSGSSITISNGSIQGPWALSISGDGLETSSLAVKSNWYSYFRMAPSAMDLAHRFRYENGCDIYLSSTSTCPGYLEISNSNWAATWFADLSSDTEQTFNMTSGSWTSEKETTGVITKYGADASHFAGYVSVDGHKRQAIANSTPLTDGSTFASAYDVIAVGLDYLAVGTESTTTNIVFSQCYSGSDAKSYAKYCPGYNTKATFWLLSDPTASKKSSNPYITPSTSYPYTGSAMGIAQVDSNNNYIAVGYSSTKGYGSYAKNLAVYWDLEAGALNSTPTAVPIFSGSANPGTDKDYIIDNSWAVAINDNGYIIGNRAYRKSVKLNYPTEMFIAKYGYDADSGTYKIIDKNIPYPANSSGVDTEAAAINNINQVVGWTVERSETTHTVSNSTPRLQEAFLYNITSGNRQAINDLICGLDTAGAKSCAQGPDGKYYYIEYANGITDDGVIIASARRYDTYEDYLNLSYGSTGTSVVVKLTPTTTFDSDNNVPDTYIVKNQITPFDYGASSGGGSFGIFGLLAMAGAAAVGQYRRFVKKGS